MRQLWVGLIVVIVALALGIGAAYGTSLLIRNHLANLPATSTRLNRNATPGGQPGNNSRRFVNPFMNPGGNGPMMGPGMRGRGFFNCPVPNQNQTPGQQQNNNCVPFNRQVTPTPGAPGSGAGSGPF
jgi:hypothetical protein